MMDIFVKKSIWMGEFEGSVFFEKFFVWVYNMALQK